MEGAIDAEYVQTQSFWGDLGILLRLLPAFVLGGEAPVTGGRINLLGIRLDNLTMEETITEIVARSASSRPSQVCFVNADCVNIAFRRPDYRQILQQSELVLGDGIGIRIAGRLLNRNIRENVNGTDLFPRLCAALEKERKGIYLLGGRSGVPEAIVGWVAAAHPGLAVRGFHHGYFAESERERILEDIANSGAEILLVAFGAPRQDLWIREHLERCGVRVAIGVGGLFDFYSGRIPRAPVWMRELGIEWLYRFWQEPGRMWQRYFIGNFVFIVRVLRDRLRSRSAGVIPSSPRVSS